MDNQNSIPQKPIILPMQPPIHQEQRITPQTSSSSPINPKKKMFLLLGAVLLVMLLILFGGGSYVMNMQKTQPTKPVVTKIEPSQINIPTPTSISTTDWKTYADPTLRISFSYPTNATLSHVTSTAMLSSKSIDAVHIQTPYKHVGDEGYDINISVEDNPQNLSAKTLIDKYVTQLENGCSPPGCGVPIKIKETLEKYKNGNVEGYIFHTSSHGDGVEVVQVKDGKIYNFYISNGEGWATNEGLAVFEKIASTLTFTK